MTEYEEKMLALLARIAENYPAREDVRFFTADADTVPLGSILTVTFSLRTDFEIVIEKLYADVRTDCTYEWRYSGVLHEFNEVEYPYGKRVSADIDTIILTVTNAGAIDQTVGFYIKGWARLKPGAGG